MKAEGWRGQIPITQRFVADVSDSGHKAIPHFPG